MTGRWRHFLLGGLNTVIVVSLTAVFSAWPFWQSLPGDYALLRVSFTHGGVRNCRDRTPEELAALARNMRQLQVCDRRRAPVYLEMELNGETLFAENLPPDGLSGSGPSRIYQRFELPAGTYDVTLRLRDDPALEGFTSTATRQIHLTPSQSLVIDYGAEPVGFFVH
jgi:hypothetical protein